MVASVQHSTIVYFRGVTLLCCYIETLIRPLSVPSSGENPRTPGTSSCDFGTNTAFTYQKSLLFTAHTLLHGWIFYVSSHIFSRELSIKIKPYTRRGGRSIFKQRM